MKKVVMIEENELDELIKNANIVKYLVSDMLAHMDKNIQDENMGLNPNNVSEFYSKLQSAKIAIDNVNQIFE